MARVQNSARSNKGKPAEKMQDDVMEVVETVSAPNGVSVGKEKQDYPVDELHRSRQERNRAEADYVASRNLRQEEAIIVGRYISAGQRKNVLSGKVAAVEVRDRHSFWVIYDGPVIVLIPFHEALPAAVRENVQNPTDELMRQRQLLSKSLGAEVPFSVEHVEMDEDGLLIYGSRRVALERIRKRYFGEHANRPLNVGNDVVGSFIGVGPHAAWVTVCGTDVRLMPSQLSHRYMENLMDFYKPGDEIMLRVQEINFKDELPGLRLSALPCELEACSRRRRFIRTGNRYTATVTSHRKTQRIDRRTKQAIPYFVTALWLEGVEVPGFANVVSAHAGGTAFSGEKVTVEVEEITDSGYVRCRILAYLP